MKLIELSKTGTNKGKYFVMVDDQDYEWLNKKGWFIRKSKRGTDYAVCKLNNKKMFLHRFILGLTDPKIFCDHKDGNGFNCQRSNLRIATCSENNKNRKSAKGSASKYLGVNFHTSTVKKYKNKHEIGVYKFSGWRAMIRIEGVNKYLGKFNTEEDAAKKYDEFAKIHHGDFANLNFKEATA